MLDPLKEQTATPMPMGGNIDMIEEGQPQEPSRGWAGFKAKLFSGELHVYAKWYEANLAIEERNSFF